MENPTTKFVNMKSYGGTHIFPETKEVEIQLSDETNFCTNPPTEEKHERHIIWELFDYVRYRAWQKKVLTVVVVIISCVVVLDFWKFGYIKIGLEHFLAWMKAEPVLGFIAFIVLFALAIVAFIPPAVLVIMSTIVFTKEYGQLIGNAVSLGACSLGALLGAVLSFYRSHYMMRDLIKLFSRRYKIIRAADNALKKNGFRVMVLLRLCSIIPFSALNYIGGVSGVTLTDFNLSLIGSVPQFIIYVLVGATAESFIDPVSKNGNEDDKQSETINDSQALYAIQHWVLVLGCFSALFALISVIHVARGELEKELALENAASAEADEEGQGVEVTYEVGFDDEEWFWLFT